MEEEVKLKHSGVGIASFIVSIIGILACFITIFIIMIIETNNPGLISSGTSAEAAIMGLFIIVSIVFLIVSIVLGIVGVVSKNTKKVFAIIGLSASSICILFIAFLMIIGSMQ